MTTPRSSRGSADIRRGLAFAALLVGIIALVAALAERSTSVAFVVVFAACALLAALVPRMLFAWGISEALLLGMLAWAAARQLMSPAQALVAVVPAAATCWAIVLSVRGLEPFGTETRRGRWTRALVLATSVLLVALIAQGAITLGQRAIRIASHARSIDELSLAGDTIAARLSAAGAPSRTSPDRWAPVVVEAARTSGRSVYLFGPTKTDHELLIGAHWDAAGEPRVSLVRSPSQLPRAELVALRRYLANPFAYSSIKKRWVLPIDTIPYGVAVFAGGAGPTESRTVRPGVNASEFDGSYVLVLSPRSAIEWWSLETRSEYARLVLSFVLLSIILIVGMEALMLRLADERQELRTLVSVNEAREAIRRDAHDRIFNRLAGVAHALEGPDADDRTARGAAFEIRSTVDYLQTMLRGAAEVEGPAEQVTLESQLAEIAESAERIWGLSVSVDIGRLIALPPDLAWEVQCLIDEALANAGEHSGASAAHVTVGMAPHGGSEWVHFSVSDDGHWQGGSGSGSTGLRGMRTRVAHLCGEIDVVASETGTTIDVRVPIDVQFH